MILVVGCLKNLINLCRSWFSWFRRIFEPLNFRNKFLLNKNWFIFKLYQKRKRERTWKKLKSSSDLGLSTGQRWPLSIGPCRQTIMPVENLRSLSSLLCVVDSACRQITVCSRQPSWLSHNFYLICFFYWVLLSAPIRLDLRPSSLLENKANFQHLIEAFTGIFAFTRGHWRPQHGLPPVLPLPTVAWERVAGGGWVKAQSSNQSCKEQVSCNLFHKLKLTTSHMMG